MGKKLKSQKPTREREYGKGGKVQGPSYLKIEKCLGSWSTLFDSRDKSKS